MINRLADRITKHPKTVILIALLLLIPSFLGMIFTPVNYDILSYLPKDLDSAAGLTILDEEFHEASMAIIVMDGMSWNDMYELEDKFSEIEEECAAKEGEGDQTLEGWKKVHRKEFEAKCEEYGIEFSEDTLILCEEFEVVFQ